MMWRTVPRRRADQDGLGVRAIIRLCAIAIAIGEIVCAIASTWASYVISNS
jgi:hypothetical protein